MPESPYLTADDAIGFEITTNGQVIKDTVEVISIETDKNINKVGTAKIVIALAAGDGNDKTFSLSETADFIPGTEIEIKAGPLNDKAQIFKGVIVQQGIRNLSGEMNEMIVRCSEKMVKMTLGRKSKYYKDMRDSAIISAVISDAGLSPDVEASEVTHKQLIQYQSTDWDFILSRAEANGLLSYFESDKLCVKKPLDSGTAELVIDFEKDVFSYDISIESRNQLPDVSCTAWDFSEQAMVTGASTEPSLSEQGNLTGKTMADTIGFVSSALASTVPLESAELKAWADAQLVKSRLNAIQGNVTFYGNNKATLNSLIQLQGFGDRYNNMALITGIRHQIKEGLWQTTTQLGLPAEWHYEQHPVSAPANGGLLPAIYGLQIGTVKKMDTDPDGQFRIQVDVPVIAPSGDGIWARLSQFYATSGKGSFFLPEIGDEVVLGFLNEDPRFPVILGMLYSSKLSAPYTPENTNKIKALVTKSDLKLEFDETDKVITIQTPGGHKMVLSDKDKSILINDLHGNKIEMNSSGISLNSIKDIVIKASAAITLEATTGITAKASGGDVSLDGLNINAKAKVAFSAQGSAMAELKSTGSTTVKGSIVMIN
jgi:Rhs element Vgr protein